MGSRPRANPAMLLHSIAVVVLIDMIYLFILGIPCLYLYVLSDQDIEIGKAVRPQLAMRVRDASAAWKKVPAPTHLFPSEDIFIAK
jgi:hypothetical protein